MNAKHITLTLAAAGILGAGGYGAYTLGVQRGMATQPAPAASVPAAADPAGGRKVLYWHDPMVPGQKFDKPGKSPFMDMQLVPVYADDAGDDGSVSISPRVQQNLGIRTVEVSKGSVTSAIEAVGSVAYNERAVELVQARANGFVEKLYVRATLDPVKRGQPLAQLYVPDWVAAQEEYLAVARMSGHGTDALLDGARQRMRLAGMTDDLIRQVEAGGKVQARLTIRARISGVVSELSAREGMTVMAGAPLFRINGLDTIWVNADVPEGAAARVAPGNAVKARTPSLPGTVFPGKVSAILPEVDPATRTVRARIELANPGGRLVPGMFATVDFAPRARQDVLTVPAEAVIRTGERSLVMVVQGDGKFAPVEVEPGIDANGRTEIRKGLEAGQKVVVSGQFLIDSEASLRGATGRIEGEPKAGDSGTAAAKPASALHRASGTIEHIAKDEITISHGPIPSLQWDPMTMGFQPPASGLPAGIAVGDRVDFAIRATDDGAYRIAEIGKSKAGDPAPGKSASATSGGGPK